MLWNYLRIAFRSLRRRSGYATLNLVGLAVGMACCLLIGLYVQNELSYDRFHSEADRIVRVAQKTTDGGLAWIGDAILPILNDRMPKVKQTVRVTRASRQIAHERGGTVRRFEEDGFFYADTTFFEVFSGFALRKGNPKTALDQPGTVVLTPEVARRYFGDEDPMGQTLQLEDRGQTLTVTGVLEPIPSNSHLQPDLVSGFGTFFSGIGRPANYRSNSFWWPKAWTYALLKPGANRGAVERQLAEVVASERPDETASKYETALQPLTSLHLRSNLEGQPPADQRERLVMQRVGLNFFDVLGVETAAGRVFSGDRPGDLGRAVATTAGPVPPHYRGVALVVNQSVLKKFDWTSEEALGKRIRLYNRDDGTLYQDVRGKVAGVVENYHTASLRQKIPPTVYAPAQTPVPGEPESTYREVQSILVKAAPGTASRAMEALRAAWTDVLPDEVFQASFLDDQLQVLYRSEQRLGRVVGVFAGLAILVACLGLFGLATYTTQRRTKEIGIRKAVGASVTNIVVLLSTDFLKLVAVAVALGTPVAYLAARQWLAGFAYRIDLGVGPFALAAGVALAVAALTVSYHAVRAARLDPTLTLRDE
jgi:hypothetical protein